MVRVGLIDTGINPTKLVKARVVDWIDFINNNPNPYDDFGHGTECAQIIEKVIMNFAPNEPIDFVVAKVCDNQGACNLQTMSNGMDWISGRGTTAVNISIGGIYPSELYDVRPFVQKLYESGSIPVVAGGNGYGTAIGKYYASVPLFSPITQISDSPYAITVGWPIVGSGWNTDLVEDSDSGSSFSTPQVTAKAALLNQISQDPDLVWEALMVTSKSGVGFQSEPRVMGPLANDPENAVQIVTGLLCDSSLCDNQIIGQISESIVAASHATACNVPGRCGWGFPRFFDALDYITNNKNAIWFKAGSTPYQISDSRWDFWAPGYLVRLRSNNNSSPYVPAIGNMIGCTGAITSVQKIDNLPIPIVPPGVTVPPDVKYADIWNQLIAILSQSLVKNQQSALDFYNNTMGIYAITGYAVAHLDTQLGQADVAGIGPVIGSQFDITFALNILNRTPSIIMTINGGIPILGGVWLSNGVFVAIVVNPFAENQPITIDKAALFFPKGDLPLPIINPGGGNDILGPPNRFIFNGSNICYFVGGG